MAKLDIPNAADDELVRSAQKGNMAPYEELVHRHRDKIYARAFSMPVSYTHLTLPTTPYV